MSGMAENDGRETGGPKITPGQCSRKLVQHLKKIKSHVFLDFQKT